MKAKTILLVSTLLLLFTQCSAVRHNSEDHEILVTDPDMAHFDVLDTSHGWEVVISQGEQQSVRLEVSSSVSEDVIAEVRRGVLYLGMKERPFFKRIFLRDITLRAYITVTDLRRIECSGGVEAIFKTPIRHDGPFEIQMSGGSDLDKLHLACHHLKADLSGASDADVHLLSEADVYVSASGSSDGMIRDIRAHECRVDASGASDVVLSGRSGYLAADCSGSSDLSASKLITTVCDIDCSGASDAVIHVTEGLNAEASGASSIYYSGRPSKVSKSSSGASSIKHRK